MIGQSSQPFSCRALAALSTARVLLGALVLAGCSRSEPRVVVRVDGLFQRAALELVELDGATITVEGPGIAAPLVVTVDRDSASFEISVPAGAERRFTLEAWRLAEDSSRIPAYAGHEIVDLAAQSTVDLTIHAYPVGVVEAAVVVPDGTMPPDNFAVRFTARNANPEIAQPFDAPVVSGRLRAVLGTGTHELTAEFVNDGITYSLYAPAAVTVLTGQVIQPTLYVLAPGTRCSVGFPEELRALPPACRYPVEVTVRGLLSGGLVLASGDDTIPVLEDGSYTFATLLEDATHYDVSIDAQPGLINDLEPWCVVRNGSGTVNGAAVQVTVLCVGPVEPVYPLASDWNRYVTAGDDPATAEVCAAEGNEVDGCIHTGELRVILIPDLASCSGVSATDDLGAFVWQCDDASGSVRILTNGLSPAAGLTNLVDFAALDWMPNRVVISTGTESRETATGAWWGNAFVDCAHGVLPTSGEICAIAGADYDADANGPLFLGELVEGAPFEGAAVVVELGFKVFGGQNPPLVVDSAGYVWIEGRFETLVPATQAAIYGSSITRSVFRNVEAFGGAVAAVDLSYISGSRIDNLRAENATGHGLLLTMGQYNLVQGVRAENNSQGGVHLQGSGRNVIQRVVARGNYHGLGCADWEGYSGDNLFTDIVVADNEYAGILATTSSGYNNRFVGVRAFNNGGPGVLLEYASRAGFADVLSVNNAGAGISMVYGTNTVLIGVTTAANGTDGVSLDMSSDGNLIASATAINETTSMSLRPMMFDLFDLAWVGSSRGMMVEMSAPMYSLGGAYIVGGVGELCPVAAIVCPSPRTTIPTGDLAAQVVGPEASSDQAYESITDWGAFGSSYRTWGRAAGTGFLDLGQRGRCVNGTCRIYDWRVTTASLLGELPQPTIDDLAEHMWTGVTGQTPAECDVQISGSYPGMGGRCTSSYVPRALEIVGDGKGDDDLLCELQSDPGEDCIFLSKVGAFQGEGALVELGTVTSGDMRFVTLFSYETTTAP